MNHKLIIFSGIITALIGAMIGLGLAEMTKGSLRQDKYESRFYKELNNRYYPLIGAGFGLFVGMGQECIRQLKDKRDKEDNQL